MSNLADETPDRDDLDDLADWLEQRRKSRSERAAQQDLHRKIDDLAGRGLSDEDVERIARRVTAIANEPPGEGDGAGADGQGAGDGDGGDGGASPPPPKPKRTRPGRRAGNVYDWDVDADGRVVRLGTAKVYNGDDEPDQVDLPDDEDAA